MSLPLKKAKGKEKEDLASVIASAFKDKRAEETIAYLKEQEINTLDNVRSLSEKDLEDLVNGISVVGRRQLLRAALAPYIAAKFAYQAEVLQGISTDVNKVMEDLPQKELPKTFSHELEKILQPINKARKPEKYDLVAELTVGLIRALIHSSNLENIEVHWAHNNIKDEGKTDIVVSVPAIDGIGRQALFGGEAKMYFELKKSFGEDVSQLPSSPLRNSTVKILQRAISFFDNNSTMSDYRGFFTDAEHWFFCLVRRGNTHGDDMVYFTNQYTFDLTQSTKGQELTGACELMYRHLLWVNESFEFLARAEASSFLWPPSDKEDPIKNIDVTPDDTEEIFSFPVVRLLGAGRSSLVYECAQENIGTTVCVKCEPLDNCHQLVNEFHILQVLQGIPGVPRVLMLGRACGYRVLVTNVVGVPLHSRSWSQKQFQVLWTSAFYTIERIHRRGVVITDLKPEHLILSQTGLYLVDFGCGFQVQHGRKLALLFYDPIFSSRMESSAFSNPGFASDFESLAFCFYYLYHKTLPWIQPTKDLTSKELQSMKSALVEKMGTISASGEFILSL